MPVPTRVRGRRGWGEKSQVEHIPGYRKACGRFFVETSFLLLSFFRFVSFLFLMMMCYKHKYAQYPVILGARFFFKHQRGRAMLRHVRIVEIDEGR